MSGDQAEDWLRASNLARFLKTASDEVLHELAGALAAEFRTRGIETADLMERLQARTEPRDTEPGPLEGGCA